MVGVDTSLCVVPFLLHNAMPPGFRRGDSSLNITGSIYLLGLCDDFLFCFAGSVFHGDERPLVAAFLSLFAILRNTVSDRRLLRAANISEQCQRSYWKLSNDCLIPLLSAPEKSRVLSPQIPHCSAEGQRKDYVGDSCDAPIFTAAKIVARPLPDLYALPPPSPCASFSGPPVTSGSAQRAHGPREVVYVMLRLVTPLRAKRRAQGVLPAKLLGKWPGTGTLDVGCEMLLLIIHNFRSPVFRCTLSATEDKRNLVAAAGSSLSPRQDVLLQATTSAAAAQASSFFGSIFNNPSHLTCHLKMIYQRISHDYLQRSRFPDVCKLSKDPGLLLLRNPEASTDNDVGHTYIDLSLIVFISLKRLQCQLKRPNTASWQCEACSPFMVKPNRHSTILSLGEPRNMVHMEMPLNVVVDLRQRQYVACRLLQANVAAKICSAYLSVVDFSGCGDSENMHIILLEPHQHRLAYGNVKRTLSPLLRAQAVIDSVDPRVIRVKRLVLEPLSILRKGPQSQWVLHPLFSVQQRNRGEITKSCDQLGTKISCEDGYDRDSVLMHVHKMLIYTGVTP